MDVMNCATPQAAPQQHYEQQLQSFETCDYQHICSANFEAAHQSVNTKFNILILGKAITTLVFNHTELLLDTHVTHTSLSVPF